MLTKIKHALRPGEKAAGRAARGACKVGWLVDAPSGGLIYDEPRRVRLGRRPDGAVHPKSASRCPALVDFEARYFEVPCPHDIHLRMVRHPEKGWSIQNLIGDGGSVRPSKIAQAVHLVSPKEWRHPDRPMIQVSAPYRFIADDAVYITQCGPFMDYQSSAWPGLVFGGRFPVHIWPRGLMWAFEWYDTSRELKIRRGDPWFYVYFEGADPARQVQLVEAEMTPQLRDYARQIDGVTNYVNQTFSLFDRARRMRPETLLKERSHVGKD